MLYKVTIQDNSKSEIIEFITDDVNEVCNDIYLLDSESEEFFIHIEALSLKHFEIVECDGIEYVKLPKEWQ